jgi:hypothetical protein
MSDDDPTLLQPVALLDAQANISQARNRLAQAVEWYGSDSLRTERLHAALRACEQAQLALADAAAAGADHEHIITVGANDPFLPPKGSRP